MASRSLLLLLAVAVVVNLSSCTNTSNCTFTSMEDCTNGCIVSSPPSNVYLNEGESITLSVEADPSSPSLLFSAQFKDGEFITEQNNKTLCDPKYCIFDLDSPRLEIVSFNTSFSVGSYRMVLNSLCEFNFNIVEAVAPTLEFEDNLPSPYVLNNDGGPLVLAPKVNHGIPPGEVVWLKEGVNISNGDEYTKNTVAAADRGVYTARIENEAGFSTLDYSIFINFPPILTLTTVPADTNPALTQGPIKVICNAIIYPEITSGDISIVSGGQSVGATTVDGTLQPGLHYEATVEYTINNGCPSQEFYCNVANGIFDASTDTIRICQKAPNVTMVRVSSAQSTNESVYLTWTLDPPSAVVSVYEIKYRLKGTSVYTTISKSDTSTEFYLIKGLSPGREYEFIVGAIDNSVSTIDLFSSPIVFTTFTKPINTPTGLKIQRNQTAIQLVWNEPSNIPSHAPVTGYDIVYVKSDNSSQVRVRVDAISTSYIIVEGIDNAVTYFFTVRARNDWGTGKPSAEVEARRPLVVDPDPLNVMITLDVSFINSGRDNSAHAVLDWTITPSTHSLISLDITISRIESTTVNAVAFFPVATYNITEFDLTQKCFSGLNTTDTYQYCLQPYTSNRNDLPSICAFSTLSEILVDTSVCYNVVPERLGSGQVIPSWAIAVIVVSAVGLVFIFFGGCGLYFGLRRNKKGELEYEGHNESFDKVPHNGNYPYPPPPPRAMSPSRSCMSYRHNNHGHHLDWQGVTAV